VLRPSRSAAFAAPARPSVVVVVLHAAAFAALLAWSWRKWPDPLVDFGRELYVPWQLTNGRMLYRDIASLFGPLSPYVNALWFRLFGASLMTLAMVNTAILAATIAGIYHLLRTATDRVTAASATLAAVLLFGFTQYLDVGNYNWATPYSHEATHGVALSVAALVAWQGAIEGRRGLAAVSGACCGLVALTKPEVAAALAVAIAAGFGGAWFVLDRRAAGRTIVPFVVALVLPAMLFFFYFHVAGPMSVPRAAGSVAAGWIPVFTTPIARNAFYERVTGFDRPLYHAFQMVLAFAGVAAFVAMAIALCRTSCSGVGRIALLGGQGVWLLLVAFAVPYFGVSRALPLIALTGFAYAAVSAVRATSERDRRRALALLAWSAFSVAMLAKMLLNAQIYHYGFYLALPATTLTVVVLLWIVPRAIGPFIGGDAARRTRQLLAAAVFVSVAPHLALSNMWFGGKTIRVGSGADMFLASAGASWQGDAVREAVAWVQHNAPSDATLAVVPEGIMINYLARRQTPVPFVNFMPPELMAFGEGAMIDAFARHPPDFVLIVDRDTSEYGYASFGADPRYGARLMAWLRDRYERVTQAGRDPLRQDAGGIVVMRRKT
jgi:hypothetical protein